MAAKRVALVPLVKGLAGWPRWVVAMAGAVGASLCWTGLLATDVSPAARASLGVASLAVGLWGSELLALPITALLAMLLLVITGAVGETSQAFAGFASPVLFFLLGSVGLGVAGERTGLADRLAATLLKRSRGSGKRLLRDLLLSLPLQALLVPSAMSRNAVLVPVYDRVLAQLGRPPRLGAAVMLSLGVLGPLASSALLSGGTSPVAAAQAIGGFVWTSWFVAMAPPYYLLLLLCGLALWLTMPPEKEVVVPAEAFANGGGGLTNAEWRVAVVAIGTSLLWIMDWFTHWSPAIPALLALFVLLLPRVGVMTWQDFVRFAPWSTCFVLAAAVSLAGALMSTGAAQWVAAGLFGWFPAGAGSWYAALAVYGVTAIIALAIPNRAAAITLIIPLAATYVRSGVLSPAVAGLIVLIAVDLETIYPAQTAANLLAYDRGYFSAGQLARFNVVTLLCGAVVVVLTALPWWQLVGVG
ncbi:MAG: SLC13 family permease [Chloroflexota bacterium]